MRNCAENIASSLEYSSLFIESQIDWEMYLMVCELTPTDKTFRNIKRKNNFKRGKINYSALMH